ncbi:p28-like protein (plasmid) [Piscirickettsia salmonis]|uniref:KilA-N domain-containing protein n=1 Tax=Piscirickettsia salmonis TaxID=1238 RepID=UPI0012B8C91D|nr:KilA-N domain-containing protein [Piscirickettsia salmonis]QGP52486.1 p28-like protein [Piscirickettsia salmonis]
MVKKVNDPSQLELKLPVIQHSIDQSIIDQRATDGYVNATALCKAGGKKLNDYQRLSTTKSFLDKLSSVTGIPVTGLIEVRQGGIPELQGSWVHPKVAINLGQWVSADFAVQVSEWIFEWMEGGKVGTKTYELPQHLQRLQINQYKIPSNSFSMLNEVITVLFAKLEFQGFIIPDYLMPDISVGNMFCGWLRENGYDPDSFPTYEHTFPKGDKRKPVEAKLYPNKILGEFRDYLETWIADKAKPYFNNAFKRAISNGKVEKLEGGKVQKDFNLKYDRMIKMLPPSNLN